MTFTGGSETLAPVVRTIDSTFHFNFGQRPFSYSEPTDYKSLCSENLPTPTIILPTQHFDSLLYTGTGLTHSITGLNFAPDWVWIKERSSTSSHTLADTVRGAQKLYFQTQQMQKRLAVVLFHRLIQMVLLMQPVSEQMKVDKLMLHGIGTLVVAMAKLIQ